MRVTGYAYPWNVVEEPDFLARVGELGVDEVAVAVSYHSTRAATPWSTERTAVFARHAAFYRPVREGRWGRLRPAAPDWVRSPDSAGEAMAALRQAGVPAAAWLVLTHDSRLGSEFPELAVRNCFGESYPWALCPAHEEVREYAATLVAEAIAGLDASSVILEACGQLGAIHQCQHEKTDAVWAPAVARLLSVCCCPACARGWGLDPDEVRARLRQEVSRLLATGDLGRDDDELEFRDVLLATRQRATDALRRAVLERIGPGIRIVLHGAIDPWVTGALPGLTPSAANDVDEVVLQCWQPGEASVSAVAMARSALPTNVEVGSYVTVSGPAAETDASAIGSYVAKLGAAGAGGLHLYHLGLAGPARWPAITAAVRAAHA